MRATRADVEARPCEAEDAAPRRIPTVRTDIVRLPRVAQVTPELQEQTVRVLVEAGAPATGVVGRPFALGARPRQEE